MKSIRKLSATLLAFSFILTPLASVSAQETTTYPSKYYNVDSNGKVTKHIFANGVEIATIEGTGDEAKIKYIHTDNLGSTNVVTDEKQRKYIGQEYDADTKLNYLNARYYDGSVGRFLSQDPVFLNPQGQGKEIYTTFLTDPQSQNSYSYAKNNPITFSDPEGKWYEEYLTGKQSWNDFSGEVGEATQYMSNGWQTAMEHPIIAGAVVGAGAWLAAYGTATGLTVLSLENAAGWGTRNLANLGKLGTLTQVPSATDKIGNLATRLGQTPGSLLSEASRNGQSFVDYAAKNLGNINTYIQQSSDKLTRVTTDPTISRIISVGTAKVSQLVNNIASGRQVPLSQSQGINGLIKGIINSLKK
ncbi:RHS repeat-associated core domain-containing protein [Candidatus Nomurabacteria bacterium]|nr:RHS repeat-associated core domain-containing protein [Candidatus Nomurabacteria bacterium]